MVIQLNLNNSKFMLADITGDEIISLQMTHLSASYNLGQLHRLGLLKMCTTCCRDGA